MKLTCLLVTALSLWPAPSSAAGERSLTSPQWRPGPEPIELHWELLRLPERVLDLALAPIKPLIELSERYTIDKRIYDLLTNDAETVFFLPFVDIRSTDGFSGGALLKHSDLFGGGERVSLNGFVQADLDYQLSASYRQRIARLDGRLLRLAVKYRDDSDLRYYGVGGRSSERDERALSRRHLVAEVTFGLIGRELLALSSELTLRYRRIALGRGEQPGVPSIGEPGDEVEPPAGFGQTSQIPEFELSLVYDTRDAAGRPTVGALVAFELTSMVPVEDKPISGMRALLRSTYYLEILPQRRVLAIGAGVGMAFPLREADDLPLDGHVLLGRSQHLRGYDSGRFRDRFAWWASLEYSFPVLEYEAENVEITPTFFFDLARAGADAQGLFGETPLWSAGFGIDIGTLQRSFLRFQVGFSPEDVQLIFALTELL